MKRMGSLQGRTGGDGNEGGVAGRPRDGYDACRIQATEVM